MDWTRHGPLVGAILFVVAVGAIVPEGPTLPPELAASLQVRLIATGARALGPDDAARPSPATPAAAASPAPPEGDGEPAPEGTLDPLGMGDLVAATLSPLAGRFLAEPRDRLLAAEAAAVAGARHLVPLFAGPLAADNPAAEVLVRWALDPGAHLDEMDLRRLGWYGAGHPLDTAAVGALAMSVEGSTADAAREAWAAEAGTVRVVFAVIQVVFFAALLLGAGVWIGLRRRPDEPAPDPPPPDDGTTLSILEVCVYFAAVVLTVGTLGPRAVQALGFSPTEPLAIVALYAIQGAAGLLLVARAGARRGDTLAGAAGWAGAFAWRGLGRSILWGFLGWCLIWPVYLGATVLSAMLLGQTGDVFENPVAILLATQGDAASALTLVMLVGVLAPFVEESIFRGFVHNRLRRRFPARSAAWLSGLIFAAAHLSMASLLPLAAVGFAIATAYDRTRDLATPMIAHGLWNLTTALILLAAFS